MKTMIDIVERLRKPPFGTETSERNIMAKAADEITRLRALVYEAYVEGFDDGKNEGWICRPEGQPWNESHARAVLGEES